MEPFQELSEGLQSLNMPGERIIDRFAVYHDMLLAWNRKINLISKTDETRIVRRHFLESIGILKYMDFPENATVLDVGTGGGFPGVPVKLLRHDLSMVLVESVGKKVRFLETVVKELKLTDIRIVAGRIEDYNKEIGPADYALSRAVTDLATLAGWCAPCLMPRSGILAVIKGRSADKELQIFQKQYTELNGLYIEQEVFNPFPDIHPMENSTLIKVRFFKKHLTH